MTLVLAKRRPLKATNPFAFPGGSPGFNPAHPIANGISAGHGFSGVAMGGTFVSLLTGQKGTNANAPTATVLSGIGPGVNYSASNMNSQFAGQSTTNDTSITFAGILQIPSISTTHYFFATGTGANGIGAYIDAGAFVNINAFGAGNTGNATTKIIAGTPFFVAVSRRGSDGFVNYVSCNLTTGAVSISTRTDVFSPLAPNGTYIVGNRNSAGAGLLGVEGAVVFCPNFFPMTVLVAFAQDPWSFWYP